MDEPEFFGVCSNCGSVHGQDAHPLIEAVAIRLTGKKYDHGFIGNEPHHYKQGIIDGINWQAQQQPVSKREDESLLTIAYLSGSMDKKKDIINLIEKRIKDIEGNGHTVLTVTRVDELQDLKNLIINPKSNG